MAESVETIQFNNSIDTDFKVEVVVSSLIEQGFDPNLIQILRDGMARRAISKDIEKTYLKYNNDDLNEYFHIHVNRESMYDMLPERMFHQTVKKRNNPDAEDMVDEIKIHRQKEFFARRFFQLFEQPIDKTLVDIYLTEARYDRNEYVNMFTQYWPVLKLLSHKQAVAFLHIIPLLSEMRSNLDEIAESLSFILNVPVQITKIILPAKKTDSLFESHLGKIQLGVDLVLGNSFADGEYDLQLTLGPLSSNRMRGFLEGQAEDIVLKKLCEIFLPEKFYLLDFKIDPADSVFTLSDDEQITYLGISSFV